MKLNNLSLNIVQEKLADGILRYNYYASENSSNLSKVNSVIETFDLTERFNETVLAFKESLDNRDTDFGTSLSKSFVNPGGWQSWAPGFEILPGQKQLSLKNKVVPQWNVYLTVPGTDKKDYSKKNILAQFITYFRIENRYFVIASTGNVKGKVSAPVQFVINRKKNSCKITVADTKKVYEKDELVSQIAFFAVDSFEEAKAKIEILFGSSNPESKNYAERFGTVSHLGNLSQGWESWYNHYADIDEKLILEDLESITTTDNLISLNRKESSDPCVFQIDDGWEIALGDWEWNEKRFASKPEDIVKKIKDKDFIPGLWIAPFIIDSRSKTAVEHPNWLLRNDKGKLVGAGFNPLWGEMHCNIFKALPGTFYCLDLSNEEVLSHLDALMDKAINKWGFEYLKLDFLYAGMLNGNFKNGGSAYEHYAKAVNILTSRTKSSNGNKVCYLGCGAPFELSFNNFPLTRIGCDTKEHWEDYRNVKFNWNGRTSAYLNMQDTIGRNLWNKTVFLNDPDVLFIRKENCSLDEEEKLLVSAVAFMFGSQMMYSDDPASSVSEEEVSLAKKILALKEQYYGKNFEAVPVKDKVYFVSENASAKKYILNLSDKDYECSRCNAKVRKHSFIEL